MFGKTASLTLFLLCAPWLLAQNSGAAATDSSTPAIAFSLDWPAQNPPHYSISLSENGAATYEEPASDGPANDPPFTVQWTLSPALRTQIFTLAKEAGYFKGKSESKIKVANTGTKVLSYKDSTRNSSVSYNYINDKSILELTRIFQGIALTVHLGAMLQHDLRYDHLGLNAHLKTLQEQQKSGQALEMQAIESILQKLAGDRAVMNIAQQRAVQILKTAGLQEPQ